MVLSILRSCFMYAYIFTWIGSARSQCQLQVLCHGVGNSQTYLANEIPTNEQQSITCTPQSGLTLEGWSQSPGGSETTAALLPVGTFPSKYAVDGNILTINDINRTDEGLYRCVYEHEQTIPKLCIFVYGQAVFASCPRHFDGCIGDPVPLTVEEGGNVKFNATVIHTPGGSCGFQQEIKNVQLMKINPKYGVDDEQLLFCDTESTMTCSNSRVSLSRGNDPGFEFVFTLSRANISDSGIYEVRVETKHPSSSSDESISKRFHLNISPTQTTTGSTTLITETDAPRTTPTTQTTTGSTLTTETDDTSDPNSTTLTATISVSSEKSSLLIPIIVAVVVPMLIVMIVATVIVILSGVYYMFKRTSKKKIIDSEKVHVTSACSGRPAKEGFRGDVMIPQGQGNANDTTIQLAATPPVDEVAELPPPNYRTSVIESDSNDLFDFDMDVDDQDVGNV